MSSTRSERGGSEPPISSEWNNSRLESFVGASDYYTASFGLGSDFNTESTEAVFYVCTLRGTLYWAKPRGGGNFQIKEGLFNRVAEVYRDGVSRGEMVGTQARSSLQYLNPGRCL